MSERARQRAVEGFLEWAAVRGVLDGGEQTGQWETRLELLLRVRETYLGKPDPTRWRSGDVHQLLMDYVVPRQVDLCDLAGQGMAAVRQYLRFLDETERLHPASTKVPTLLQELDRLAAQYPAAMADSSRYWLAKRVFTAMNADGVDTTDQAAADAWAAAFTARDPAGRRSVLGELMDRNPGYGTGALLIRENQVAVLRPGMPADKSLIWPDACDCGCAQREFPSAVLPPPAALAAAVATEGAGLLGRLQRLAAWVGPEGKPANRRGELAKQDAHSAAEALELPTDGVKVIWDLPALSALWQLALEFDVLTLYRTRVLPGSGAALVDAALRGDGSGAEAIKLWADIYDELVQPETPPDPPMKAAPTREWMRIWAPRFLGLLYSHCPNGELTDFNDLTRELLTEQQRLIPEQDAEVFTTLAMMLVVKTLTDLEVHGGVQLKQVDRPELPPGTKQVARATGTLASALLFAGAQMRVRLTDLGRYAIQRQLLPQPVFPPPAEAPAVAASPCLDPDQGVLDTVAPGCGRRS
jgi:hypothetical protein